MNNFVQHVNISSSVSPTNYVKLKNSATVKRWPVEEREEWMA